MITGNPATPLFSILYFDQWPSPRVLIPIHHITTSTPMRRKVAYVALIIIGFGWEVALMVAQIDNFHIGPKISLLNGNLRIGPS